MEKERLCGTQEGIRLREDRSRIDYSESAGYDDLIEYQRFRVAGDLTVSALEDQNRHHRWEWKVVGAVNLSP
jgi:hypothetical protein